MKKINAYGVSSVQGSWPVQEDGYFIHPMHGIYSIADGFGGLGAGDLAAKNSLAAVRAFSQEAGKSSMKNSSRMAALFQESNKQLIKWNEPRNINKKGGCSLVVASVSEDRKASISQCGACFAQVLHAGKMNPILLPQADYSDSPMIPNSALGLFESCDVESREVFLQSGDFLIMGSSGILWNSDSFTAEFLQQLALRGPQGGADLGALVNHMATTFGGSGGALNRSLLVLEIA